MLTLPEDTERLVHRIASKSGQAPLDVVRHAVEASARSAGLAVDASQAAPASNAEMIASARAIAASAAARPILDTRTDDEILGYDNFGLPV